MKKRLQSIIRRKERAGGGVQWLYPFSLCALLLLAWQGVSFSGLVKGYLLPSPVAVAAALVQNAPALLSHGWFTVAEALAGLAIGVAVAVASALLMERVAFLYRAAYPLMIISQTIPSIALAPLLVLWLGYGVLPKIVLVALMCFFPVAVGMLDGLRSADGDAIVLLRVMGARPRQVLWHIKLPSSLGGFFSGLKISVSYAVVGAVISEWLGGNRGLGVYMTRVRKSYAYDKMFAVIFVISLLSLLLMEAVARLERRAMPWLREDGGHELKKEK